MNNATSDYVRLLRIILENFLPHPENINIYEEKGVRMHEISVQVHGGDHAFVIGRDARMVKALQTILNHMATVRDEQVQLGILDPQIGRRGQYEEFKSDTGWDDRKSLTLKTIYAKVVGYIMNHPIECTVVDERSESIFSIRTDNEIPVTLLTALQTVARAMGKAHGRNVVINSKVKTE